MLPFWGSWREAPVGDFDSCFGLVGVDYVHPLPAVGFAADHLPHIGLRPGGGSDYISPRPPPLFMNTCRVRSRASRAAS